MKRVLYSGLAVMVMACLTSPAWAQKGGHGRGMGAAGASQGMSGMESTTGTQHGKSQGKSSSHRQSMSSQRSNKGGATRGLSRAEQVQQMNNKADVQRGFTTAPGMGTAQSHQANQSAANPGKSAAHNQKGKQNQNSGNH
jgi:hypothetical protein